MEFDSNTWAHNLSSEWLVKFTDDNIYTGQISSLTDEVIEVHEHDRQRRFSIKDIEWIRPLISLSTKGWTVIAGFQAEDFTFDTWWQRDDVLLLINFSDRSGFSNQQQFIGHHLDSEVIEGPSASARESAHHQLHKFLMDHRDVHVSPAAHLS